MSRLNLELIAPAWHLSLIQKGHAVAPGTQGCTRFEGRDGINVSVAGDGSLVSVG